MAKSVILQSWLTKPTKETPYTAPAARQTLETSEPAPKKRAPTKTASKPTRKSSKLTSANDAKKIYKSAVETIKKKSTALDKRVKAAGPNSRAVTSDTYAQAMEKFIKDVRKLMDMGEEGVIMAFNLLLEMGQHSRGDFHMSMKMCGFGESGDSYQMMDECMLEVIEKRKEFGLGSLDKESFKISKVWEEKYAMDYVGEFKTGRPNKQQRGQLERHRAE
ncbi:hypothetical protein GLAREA_09108 [Glarea lozoyensis ATCC 20868]|uniref:Uncharacterized protein n=1 Tax=Glarea lozoyensis (strain ATCC 20868 / MF5171) TaxID=1116229 RepID=S3DGW5_GLAL2|nr:uncharacterized protein GLAREA_09108 [Glarea lozoyensis ATCC 20868]EPE36945.1 hypothetical protein GLAREA_09108 [Glarea lozoyensis ATCC 20868]